MERNLLDIRTVAVPAADLLRFCAVGADIEVDFIREGARVGSCYGLGQCRHDRSEKGQRTGGPTGERTGEMAKGPKRAP